MEAIRVPRMARDPEPEIPPNAVVSYNGTRMTIKEAADLLGDHEAEYREISKTAIEGERVRGAQAQAEAFAKVRGTLRRPGFKVPGGDVLDLNLAVDAARAEIDRGHGLAEESEEAEGIAADEEE